MIAGLVLVILIDINLVNKLILSISIIIAILTSLISRKIKIPLIYWFLENMDRKEDLKNHPGKGAIYFLVGCLLALILFDKNLALASIIILTLGDAVSPLIGIHFGKTTHPLNNKKLLEGTIAGIIISFIGALMFINYKEALIASVFGMLIEAVEIKFKKEIINDNITIPLVSSLSVYIFRMLI